MSRNYRVVAPDRFLSAAFIEQLVLIRYAQSTLLSTDEAVQLREGDRPLVTYVPANALISATLVTSDTEFHCRWKGQAAYFDVLLNDGSVIADGAWGYPDAPEEIALLRDRVSFDTTRFTIVINE